MEPQERGRGEGKAEGRGERRIMAELLTTPWTAEEDFLHQCAGVGADRRCYLPTPSVQPPGMARMTGGESDGTLCMWCIHSVYNSGSKCEGKKGGDRCYYRASED